MENVFTPLDENYQRLKFNMSDVKVLSGEIFNRQLGKLGIVKIKDTKYNVYGQSCSLPNCNCDVQIKKVK